jgi:hypothetical protein
MLVQLEGGVYGAPKEKTTTTMISAQSPSPKPIETPAHPVVCGENAEEYLWSATN